MSSAGKRMITATISQAKKDNLMLGSKDSGWYI
jgi:hypothetical protein